MAIRHENFLTTRQLAHLWHVGEATIKRWADAGHLHSTRTLGGHRRFSLVEVARFQNERGLGATTPARERGTASRSKKKASSSKAARAREARERRAAVDNFFDAIIEGREAAATALLLEAYLGGTPLVRVFDETVTAAMHRVGQLWHGGQLSVADEHLATRTATRALDAISRSVRRNGDGFGGSGGSGVPLAICCATEDEWHELSLLCAQVLLESEGWNVKNFGANTPFFALAGAVERHRPRLVCISSTTHFGLERSAREYMQFHAAAQNSHARIVLGGEAFRPEAVRRSFPADLYAANFIELMDFVTEGESPIVNRD